MIPIPDMTLAEYRKLPPRTEHREDGKIYRFVTDEKWIEEEAQIQANLAEGKPALGFAIYNRRTKEGELSFTIEKIRIIGT